MTNGKLLMVNSAWHNADEPNLIPLLNQHKRKLRRTTRGHQQPISRNARINPISSLGRVTRPNLGSILKDLGTFSKCP